MKANAIPVTMPVVWGASAGGSYLRPVPVASQIGIQAGAASYTDGFPPLTMTPTSLGGVPPFGQDMNGALNAITAWVQWTTQAGVPAIYDGSFSSDIGGYPQGALIQSAMTTGLFWLSTKDDNTSNPDSGGGGWNAVWPRIALTGNADFYVSTTGNDSHSGLSSGQAWLTLQHAYDTIVARYDINGFNANVMLADGTYGAGFTANGAIVGATGLGALSFQSSSGNPAACIVSCSSGACVTASNGGDVKLQQIKFVNSGGQAFFAFDNASIAHQGCEFGTCSAMHILARTGARITSSTDYLISGGAPTHIQAQYGAVIRQNANTITLTGTPAFASGFAIANSGGIITFQASPTFSGGATGPRYSATGNGVIDANAAGASYFPGNSAGSTATGGQYV